MFNLRLAGAFCDPEGRCGGTSMSSSQPGNEPPVIVGLLQVILLQEADVSISLSRQDLFMHRRGHEHRTRRGTGVEKDSTILLQVQAKF
jgi:hypothetical protein